MTDPTPSISRSASSMLATMLDPRSTLLRSGTLFVLLLSGIFFLAGLGVYSTSGLSQQSPSDDMGGGGDWTEGMMFGFLLLPLITNTFFITRARTSARAIHLGYYLGIDLFVALTLLAIWCTSLVMSRFVLPSGCDASLNGVGFFCHPKWGTVRGLFVTGYALVMLLVVQHGTFFAIAAWRLAFGRRGEKGVGKKEEVWSEEEEEAGSA